MNLQDITMQLILEDKLNLTKSQQQIYDEIVEKVNIAKSSKNVEDFYIKSQVKNIVIPKSLNTSIQDIENEYREKFRTLDENDLKIWEEIYKNALNGITKIYSNSNTIRALEQRGYIKILTDGLNNLDIVQLI